MAINYPGPHQVRVFIETDEPAAINEHVLALNCVMQTTGPLGGDFSEFYPIQKGGGTSVPLSDAVDALIAIIEEMYSDASTFVRAELWQYVPLTFDASYVTAYSLAQPGVDNVNNTVVASQTIWTFRTTAGGVVKLDMRGTTRPAGLASTYPTGGSNIDAIFAYMLANTTPWIGRDNGYALAALRYLPGQNERLWKKLYR